MTDTQKVGGILRNGIVLKQNLHLLSAIKSNSPAKRKLPHVFTKGQNGFSSVMCKSVGWATAPQHLPHPQVSTFLFLGSFIAYFLINQFAEHTLPKALELVYILYHFICKKKYKGYDKCYKLSLI